MLTRELVDDTYCQGVEFTVQNVDTLACAVAFVLTHQHKLAKDIVAGASADKDNNKVTLDGDDIDDIINRRLNPTVVYHRDGFLFQLMMWLATYIDIEGGDLVSLPHSQCSAKGQDSIVVHRNENSVVAISICEDKATESPRKAVREKVWPEFRDYESGGRRDELRSNIIATLGLGNIPSSEAERLVHKISWDGTRRYRVRVTVQSARTKGLFKGFDELVDGSHERRRGETMLLPEMRSWMTKFSARVEKHLRARVRK